MSIAVLWLSRGITRVSHSYGSTGTTGNQSPSRINFPTSCVPFYTSHSRLSDLPTKTQFGLNEWQYLTVDQALEDFVVFAKGFTLPSASQIQLKSADALQPQNTPWVVVGASYPGIRAALLRARNPEVVFASWSSSGPVQAQINMASYYEAAQRALPSNCSSDWVAVTKYVDGVLVGCNTTEQIVVKRALYVARMSGPGGNTTLVRSLSDTDVLNIPSDQIAAVLMDPLIPFQVSRGFIIILKRYSPCPRIMGYKPPRRSVTGWKLAISRITLHRKVLLLPRVSMPRSTRLWLPSAKSTIMHCSEKMMAMTCPTLYVFSSDALTP